LPEGKQAVVSWLYAQQKFVERKQERLWTNVLPILKFPKELRRYYVTNIPDAVKDDWPTYKKSRDVVWAFGPPGKETPLSTKLTKSANWTTELEVDDLDTFSIASGILREAILNYCARKGMAFSEDRKDIYFPFGLLPNDKLGYKRYDGKTVSVKVVGRKTIRRRTGEREVSWYHIAPVFQPILNRFGDPCYQINFRLIWTDRQGVEQKVPTGRRRLKWYNYQWLARTFALISWLTEGKDPQDILTGEDFSISISGKLLDLRSQDHINEDAIGESPEDDENEEVEELESEEEENYEEPMDQIEDIGKPD
jgi:hypothetical protein